MLNKQPLTASTSEPTTKEPHLKERAGKATAEQQRELKKEARRRFEIGPRYTMMTVLGEGAYGVVCSASDGDNNGLVVAVKKIAALEHPVAGIRALRELRLLHALRGKHPNVINLLSVLAPTSSHPEEIYLVQAKLDSDLHRVLRIQTLSDRHCRYFASQVVHGVLFLHRAGIIHRDLKPSNLFVNANCELRIGDFGLARMGNNLSGSRCDVNNGSPLNDLNEPAWTDYVATRWYRAPELLLDVKQYDRGIDMWAVGCVIAEMILGTAIFPGKDLVDQLSLILGKLNDIAEADFSHFRQDRAKLVERQIKVKPVATAQAEIMGCGRESGTELAVDLVMRLLTIDPKRRMTVEEAVQHEYISKSSYVLPEPQPLLLPADFLSIGTLDKENLNANNIKKLIHHELKLVLASLGKQ